MVIVLLIMMWKILTTVLAMLIDRTVKTIVS